MLGQFVTDGVAEAVERPEWEEAGRPEPVVTRLSESFLLGKHDSESRATVNESLFDFRYGGASVPTALPPARFERTSRPEEASVLGR